MSKLHFLVFVYCMTRLQQIAASPASPACQENSRIVGGTLSSIEKAKFVVHLREKGKFFCGGALVAPKFIITAAHCLEGVKASDITVVAGATHLSEMGVRSQVAKVFVPKKYNPKTFDMDIAVLELANNLKGVNISTIDVCHSMCKANEFMAVYGWGQMSENNEQSSNQLRTVRVPVMEQKKCRNMFKKHGQLTETMFCAGDLMGKDACTGDSGGPAVCHNHLCGVVSWGIGCARKRYPGVYTNIMKVKHFIDKVMYKTQISSRGE